MRGITQDFLLFIAGVFIILILLSTVFGKHIAYNILGFLAEINPTYLQEEIRTLLIEASNAPGEFEAKIKLKSKYTITIDDNGPYPTVLVKTPAQLQFSQTQPTPITFLTNCKIVKTCVKEHKFIGDHCRGDSECYGDLKCDDIRLICYSQNCGDNNLDSGEECDPPQENSTQCSGYTCLTNCTCSNIRSNEGEICTSNNDCFRTECLSKAISNNIGETLIIKKFFENNLCKIKIEALK